MAIRLLVRIKVGARLISVFRDNSREETPACWQCGSRVPVLFIYISLTSGHQVIYTPFLPSVYIWDVCCWRSVVPCLSLALPWGRVHIYRMDFVIHPLPSLAGFRYEVIILKYLQQPLLVPSHTITSLYWTPGLELRSPVTRPIFMRSLLTAGQGSISHQSLMFTCFTFYGC